MNHKTLRFSEKQKKIKLFPVKKIKIFLIAEIKKSVENNFILESSQIKIVYKSSSILFQFKTI